MLKGSDGHIEYSVKKIFSKYNLEIPEQKLAYLDECCAMLTGVYSEMEREIFIQRISSESGISPDVIRTEVTKRQNKRKRQAAKDAVKAEINKSVGYGDRVNADSAKNLATVKKEENLLGLLIIFPEYLDSEKLYGVLSEDIFQCEFTKKVYLELVRDKEARKEGTETFGETFSPEEMGRITEMKLRRKELSNNSVDVAVELAQALKKEADRRKEDDGSEDSFFKRIEELKKSKK